MSNENVAALEKEKESLIKDQHMQIDEMNKDVEGKFEDREK